MKKDPLSRPAFRVALSGIVAALGVALMLLTSLIPFGTYAFPCAAGALLVIIVIELNAKWALGVYAAVSLLSFFLAGDKEAVVYYILLLGYYPMLKNLIESKVRTKPLRLLFKFAVFNAAAVGAFYITTLLLAVPAGEFSLFGVYVPLVFLAAGNLVFLLYDLALTSFVVLYVRKIRGKVFSVFK